MHASIPPTAKAVWNAAPRARSRFCRARLLALLSIAGTCAALAGCTSDDGGEAAEGASAGEGGEGSACVELADGRCVEETFANPPVLAADDDGVYTLWLAATEVELDGERHCVRAYNDGYVSPTIDTPPRDGDTPRSVRVNLENRLGAHDYQSLEGDACACVDAVGAPCVPSHVHDACIGVDTADECLCTNEEGERCDHMFDFNVTNLHAHGSHVWPDYARGGDACQPQTNGEIVVACRECGSDVCDDDVSDDTCYHADNVLNAVHPMTGAQYRWDIDEDGTHHTGLQWYHPHIHGTTAIQVASGAAGAWIVRGALDELDGIADARERIMIFSTPSIQGEDGFAPLDDDEQCTDETLTFNDFHTLGDSAVPQLNVINGVRQPRLITAPGQVERWRILHAGYLDEVWLGLFRGLDPECSEFSPTAEDALRLTQIGRDGLILPQPFEHEFIFMSPGYRVEAMLGGEGLLAHGETWCLVAARFLQDLDASDSDDPGGFLQQPIAPDEAPTAEDIFARFEDDGDVVAILNVSDGAGPPSTTTLPDYDAIGALAPELDLGGVPIAERCEDAASIAESSEVDQVAILQVGFWTLEAEDPCDCANYNVNCNNFERTNRALYPFDRDLPLNEVEHWRVASSVDGHPFHIHINPFIVCPNENVFDPIPFAHWRDTYLVNLDRRVDIITENKSYTGPFVFHCHKLTHEDHGMMELIRICDPDTDETCGDFHWAACAEDDLQCEEALAATECAFNSSSDADAAACITTLGGPGGACAPVACTSDDECPTSDACIDEFCEPAPCDGPCPPGQSCVHGECE